MSMEKAEAAAILRKAADTALRAGLTQGMTRSGAIPPEVATRMRRLWDAYDLAVRALGGDPLLCGRRWAVLDSLAGGKVGDGSDAIRWVWDIEDAALRAIGLGRLVSYTSPSLARGSRAHALFVGLGVAPQLLAESCHIGLIGRTVVGDRAEIVIANAPHDDGKVRLFVEGVAARPQVDNPSLTW